MHGLGNDFMVLDLVTQHWELNAETVAQWGDRHTGVGFDQLLVIAPPTDPDADFTYIVYNTDGSRAQQCGNGLRCIARLIHQNQLSPKATLTFQSSAGLLSTTLREGSQVEASMGQPILTAEQVPFNAPQPAVAGFPNDQGQYQIQCADQTFTVMPISMGNPHGVIFVDNIADAPVEVLGPALTAHPAFPEQANIGFCQVVDESFLRLRVHERGAGETQACGSGACAAMVAARRLGYVGERVKVSLPGGKVKIRWSGADTDAVTMTGPATRVFDGEVNL
ncbi:MAG: diaminopimelate epimerase [Pseudomonadales bacterium]